MDHDGATPRYVVIGADDQFEDGAFFSGADITVYYTDTTNYLGGTRVDTDAAEDADTEEPGDPWGIHDPLGDAYGRVPPTAALGIDLKSGAVMYKDNALYLFSEYGIGKSSQSS